MNATLDRIRERFYSLDETFRRYSLRERALIGLMAAGLVFFLFDHLLVQPVSGERERLTRAVESTHSEIERLQQEALGSAREGMTEEERRRADELRQLRLQLAQIDEQMRSRLTTLVPPESIVPILEELLARDADLRVVRMQSQPPVRIGALDHESAPQSSIEMEPPLYRHGLRMVIEGGFATTLDYLRRIEDSGWSLLWDRLEYRVDRFPRATITIDLHTLSEQEEWIGV